MLVRRGLPGSVCLLVSVTATLFADQAPPSKPFTAMQKRWWAIQKVAKPAVPPAADTQSAIDAFLLARLHEKQLQFNLPADRVTLLRRVTLDLTGLPPTPEETQAFLQDQSPAAFEHVVDRLLASPRYGERWARHWLDLARYADSEGFKSDETRPNIWRYRDYVIRSFNDDKPYDLFIKEQIAGDELYPKNPDALVATGFNRNFPDESNAAHIMLRRQELLNDITDTVGATFLGITVGCARCHDHKFDPILQRDYYRLQAFFANTRIVDNAQLDSPAARSEWQRQYDAWDRQTRPIREKMSALVKPRMDARYKERLERFPDDIQQIILMDAAKRTPYQWQMYHKALPQITFTEEEMAAGMKGEEAQQYAELKKQLQAFDGIKPADLQVAQTMADASAEAPKTYILRAGAWDAPLDEVQPGFLSILDPSPAAIPPATGSTTGRRTVLANWLASPENPLTARVMVNRIWQHHFGKGLVGTPSDFGLMGERPTNRELLDYLTSSFVEQGWSIKKLHKQILLSAAYQQSSQMQSAAAEVDPDNKLLWRYPRRRLEAESIRDTMLAVSGRLNLKMGGPGVFPPLPAGVAAGGFWKKQEDPMQANRRSVYVFVRRNLRYPLFQAFDMPDTNETCGRRLPTITPTQSLALLNDELVYDWARGMAGRVWNDAGMSATAQVERAYRLAYNRTPSDAERDRALQFLQRQSGIVAKNAAMASPDPAPTGADPKQAAALVDLCHALLNSNEFLYIN